MLQQQLLQAVQVYFVNLNFLNKILIFNSAILYPNNLFYRKIRTMRKENIMRGIEMVLLVFCLFAVFKSVESVDANKTKNRMTIEAPIHVA